MMSGLTGGLLQPTGFFPDKISEIQPWVQMCHFWVPFSIWNSRFLSEICFCGSDGLSANSITFFLYLLFSVGRGIIFCVYRARAVLSLIFRYLPSPNILLFNLFNLILHSESNARSSYAYVADGPASWPTRYVKEVVETQPKRPCRSVSQWFGLGCGLSADQATTWVFLSTPSPNMIQPKKKCWITAGGKTFCNALYPLLCLFR